MSLQENANKGNKTNSSRLKMLYNTYEIKMKAEDSLK